MKKMILFLKYYKMYFGFNPMFLISTILLLHNLESIKRWAARYMYLCKQIEFYKMDYEVKMFMDQGYNFYDACQEMDIA